jgi:hypothetical protein
MTLLAVALCSLATAVIGFSHVVQCIRLERRIAQLEWAVRGRLWSLAARDRAG